MSKDKQLATQADKEVLAQLAQSFPTDPGALRIMLPRISMASQDKTEGKGKATKVIIEAGTFFTEAQADELDEDGKKVWTKEEIGTEMDAIILFQRKQLRHYDEATETYTSSTVFDTDDEIVPLFANKKEVARGTPEQLKKGYEYTKPDGKIGSKLEDNKILYILYKGEKHQLNLRGSSMYAFKTYCKGTQPNTVVTRFGSEAKEKGSNCWNQMTFKAVRQLNADEAVASLKEVTDVKTAINIEKATYANANKKVDSADTEMDKLTSGATLD